MAVVSCVLLQKLTRNKSLLFWDVTQRSLVVSYRRFGTAHRSHLRGQGVVQEDLYSESFESVLEPKTNLRLAALDPTTNLIYL
jgi:hypothetical protein